MATGLKERITQFWNKKPCGTGGEIPENPDKEYFDNIRERRYKLEPFILNLIAKADMRGKKVLEIGCGMGTDGVSISKTGADYTGVDLSPGSLALARKNFELHGFSPENIKEADAENLPFENNTFDFIYSWCFAPHYGYGQIFGGGSSRFETRR